MSEKIGIPGINRRVFTRMKKLNIILWIRFFRRLDSIQLYLK